MSMSHLKSFGVIATFISASVVLAQGPAQSPTSSVQPANQATQPKSLPTPEQLGDSLLMHQRYQAAIESYRKAPQDNAAIWNKMGIAYQLMFNMTDAIRCYQKSLKLDPKNANVLNNLGTVYDAQKDYRAAAKIYRKALKIDPHSALILKNRGTNLLAQHKYEKGWESYKQALAADPQIFDHSTRPRVENPASLQDRGAMNYYMAKGCVRAGRPDRAIEYLRMAINEGFTDAKKISADTEFASLHGIPAFEQLLAEQQAQKAQ